MNSHSIMHQNLRSFPFIARLVFMIVATMIIPLSAQAQKSIRCDVCFNKISGKYMSFKSEREQTVVCSTCYATRPTCTTCRIPHKREDLTLYRGRELWCADCLRKTDDCELCENPIKGKYFTLDFSDGKWCEDCMQTHDSCFFCQEPYDEPGHLLEPGKSSCNRCNQFAIHGQENYNNLLKKIHPQMEALLSKKFDPVTIKTVRPSEMMAYMNRFSGAAGDSDSGGFLDPIHRPGSTNDQSRMNLGLYTREGNKRLILVLDHLPEELAWEVISHELTHAWQDEHYPGVRDFYLVEGFAQLIAQKICYANNKRNRLNLLYFRSDDYGHAYRILQTFEDREGFQAVLKAVENKALPEDYKTSPPKEIFRVEL